LKVERDLVPLREEMKEKIERDADKRSDRYHTEESKSIKKCRNNFKQKN